MQNKAPELLAGTILLEGESKEGFWALLGDITDELEPQTPLERQFVEIMAVARWRHMRLWAIEKAALTYEMQQQQAAAPSACPLDIPTKAALAFKSLSNDSRSIELRNRCETANDSLFHRALEALRKTRKTNQKNARFTYRG